ncbi:MAG TPA: hypothetical protein VLJ59_17465 [Mycobacteriales bacterium]|nr:hypothetical protein [Mycobacteriales bacterium]
MFRTVRAIAGSLVVVGLLAGCGEVVGHGTPPSLPDLLIPLDGQPITEATGDVNLADYLAKFATAPEPEAAEFTGQGFVGGWVVSTLDSSFSRRVFLLQFRDTAAARSVYGWYQDFLTPADRTFDTGVTRDNFGKVADYQDQQGRSGTRAQVLYPAGPFLVMVSVIVASTENDTARTEAQRLATAQSHRLP